ncbi:MAG: lipoate--protein ligase family protein [Thermoprotei archaeon]|nr:MAG: lipoate--protein ligase family protein [Thermoprotei archaeon]
MVREVRYVFIEGDVYLQMAIDEALLYLRSKDLIPDTLRLYVIKPSAITIGYFQSVSRCLNLELVKEKGIDFTRRITGGGSVYHDENGEITYAFITKAENLPKEPEEIFRVITRGVVEAAKYLGADAEFVPLNDVVIGGRKFSGQAMTIKFGAVLQHGTFMYDTDLDLLSKVLQVPLAKLKTKGVVNIRSRVTTISESIGRKVSKEEAIEALKKGFSKALGIKLVESSLTPLELDLAKSLRYKYMSDKWRFLRP